MDFSSVDRKKQRIDEHRPLPSQTLASLREAMNLEWTYNSNAIEGNTLTILETKVVLEGITVGGKSVREHLEAINHRDAILFLEESISQREPLSEWSIRNIHQLVLKNVDNQNAGRYRQENVVIGGAKHRPPAHLHVPDEMKRLLAAYHEQWTMLHPVERSARLHGEFVKIHPFIDGNGRTARLLMNFELMKHGFPPAVIKNDMRPEYYESLDLAHTMGQYDPFVELVLRCLNDSLDLYLSVLEDGMD
ncbi:MAG: Fic family protein [Bacilli bacterium]